MPTQFIHLNTHSCFSLLEGLPSPQALAQAAAAAGMPALGLTDHRLLTGSVAFYQACRAVGVKPLLGMEIDMDGGGGNGRLVVFACGREGWSSLCGLSTALALRKTPESPVGVETLEGFSEGLLALVCGLTEEGEKVLGGLKEIFSERIYLGLSTESPKQMRIAITGQRMNLPLAAMQPVYYLQPPQAALQRTLASIRCNLPLDHLPAGEAAPSGAYFMDAEEMGERYREFPQALAATLEISERCTCDLPLGEPHFPRVSLPPGMSIAELLRQKAEEGARQLYGRITPQIQARLDHELEVITARGFEPVFLIVEEILSYARAQDIPTSSRGSAASSLVAHCLKITSPDPLALDLYFERFLNPARSTPPDIDTDICSRGRDQVIQHVFDTYGLHQAAMVATINRFRPRSALGDAAKAHGLSPAFIRSLTASLPYGFWARVEEHEDDPGRPSPYADLRAAHPQYGHIFNDAEALLKIPRHLSVHAGGMVVGPGNLTDLVPLMRSGSKGVIITQMDLEAVEALGLVKIDLLGIRGLTVLGDVASAVHSWRRGEFGSRLEVLETIPLDDPQTADRVEHGQTIGCFQIESPGMRAILREIRARSPEDIMAALALFRPGPLQGGLKDAFVRRFKGEEAVIHLHPALAPVLDDTFGVIVYQEQVLRIANKVAGLSLADADLLRRAMSHFDPGKQMQYLRERFVQAALEKSGVPLEVGERIWEMMAAFAGYGFPKAHAASYAQVAWQSAWCKTYFPAEFLAAVLANWGGYYPQRVYLTEARRMGLKVRPPHVNHARGLFSTAYPQGEPLLYMGLDQVRDLTRRTQERIQRARPFSSLEDFLCRVDPRRQEAENLVLAGALEGFGNTPEMLRRIRQEKWRPGQLSLFGWEEGGENKVSLLPGDEEWTLEHAARAQEAVLGISLDVHPLELCLQEIVHAGAISTLEAAGRVGQRVCVAGVRQSSHRSRTARGESMMFLSLEDLEGMLDVVIFPDVYRRVQAVVSTRQPLLISGVVEIDSARSEPILRAEKVEVLK